IDAEVLVFSQSDLCCHEWVHPQRTDCECQQSIREKTDHTLSSIVTCLLKNTEGGKGERSSGQHADEHFERTLSGVGRVDSSKVGKVMISKNTLAMLLKWPDLEITGVTTVSEEQGRRAYLPRLAQAGRLGELIVLQAELCARREQNEHKYGETCPGLPRDIINFQHDPLACAIALGWHEGVVMETVPLKLETRESWLYEIPDSEGIPTRLVTKIDGNAFNEYWCNILCS